MRKSSTIEADWITSAGLRAIVIFGRLGFHCGYVGVPSSHPLFGVKYSEPSQRYGKAPEDMFDVHGGLTYSGGEDDFPVESDLWWFGYDCGHLGDVSDICSEGVFRDLDYCKAECESLAKQISEVAP